MAEPGTSAGGHADASAFTRSWIERAPARHPLAAQVAGRSVALTLGGDPEVIRVVAAAYRVATNGGEWDPEGGQTALDDATVERCAGLGRLLSDAGRADYAHGISPGPVVTFTGRSLLLDLRFGDPDDDARAVDAIAQGVEELGLSLGENTIDDPIVSGGS